MSLNIPEKHQEFLQQFSKIPSKNRKRLLEYLKTDEPLGYSFEELQKNLAQKFPSFGIDFAKLVEVFYSINKSAYLLKRDKDVFVDEILAALKKSGIKLEADIKDDLVNILNSSLAISSKAIELFLDSRNVMIDAKVITDIRPIFNVNNEVKINSAIILHTLKLSFKNSLSSENDFYIVLEPKDLKTLKDQIIRAESKEIELKKSLKANIKFIDLKFQ